MTDSRIIFTAGFFSCVETQNLHMEKKKQIILSISILNILELHSVCLNMSSQLTVLNFKPSVIGEDKL